MSIAERFSSAFDIRQGEHKPVLLLLLRSFFLGSIQTLVATVATTLFLETYTTQELPLAYIGAAFFAPVAGFIHYKLTQRASYTLGAGASLGLILSVMAIFLHIERTHPVSKLLPLLFYIWYFTQDTFIYNEFWALVDRLFNMRQAKRLSGLVATGDMTGRIITGLTVSHLIYIFGGVLDLLIPAMIGVVLSFFMLIYISSTWKLDRIPLQTRKIQNHDVKTYKQLLKNRYVLSIISLSVITMIAYYFVDITFISETRLFFAQQEQLAVFLGYFEAFVSLATMMSGMFLARPVIARYGITGGLLALPLVSGIGAFLISTGAGRNLDMIYIFILIAGTKVLFNAIRASMHVPSYRVLIYPLLQGEQEKTHTLIEVIVEPAIGGIVGFTLLRLVFNEVYFSRIILVLAFIWVVIVLFIHHQYAGALKRALGLRVLGGDELPLDNSDTKNLIEEGLKSSHPGEVFYALDLISQNTNTHQILHQVLKDLLRHPSWEVRKEVLQRMEKMGVPEVLGVITNLLQVEKSDDVRAEAMRVLSAIGGVVGIEEVQRIVDKKNRLELEECIVGQLRSGEIEGILWGGTELLKLEKSDSIDDRIHAARIIGKAGIDNFYRPIERMMKDDHIYVRAEAVKAAGKLKNPHLWKNVIRLISDERLSQHVITSLAEGGEAVFDILKEALEDEGFNTRDRKNLLRVFGKIRGEKAIQMLLEYLENPNIELGYQACFSLRQCGYHSSGKYVEIVRRLIKKEAGRAAWILAMITDLEKSEEAKLLCLSLKQRLSITKEIVSTLLMFLYDSTPIWNAYHILVNDRWSKERRIYALETLDTIISSEHKEMVLPLFEDLSYQEQLKKLIGLFPQKHMQPLQRLQEIVFGANDEWGMWLKACGLKVLRNLDQDIYRYHAGSLCDQLKTDEIFKLESMVETINYVEYLHSVEIFSYVPVEILAGLVINLKEENIESGASLFIKGEHGDCMYIVLSGKLLVHDKQRQIAVRGSGDIIGEMAILDPMPRSASVTALEDTTLLSVDQEHFFDLLSGRVEVSKGILKVLTRKLAEASGRS